MRLRRKLIAALVCLCVTAALAQDNPDPKGSVSYSISFAKAPDHVLHVKMQMAEGASERVLRLPVWNALYQVRDFAQHIESMSAKDRQGNTLPIQQTEKSAWRISGAQNGAEINYDIYADDPGPYGTQVNAHHAFLNIAQVLLYEQGCEHNKPVSVDFVDIPQGWWWESVLEENAFVFWPDRHRPSVLAGSYDQLVDGPIEIGRSRPISFQDGGTNYRIVIDADPADYDAAAIESSARRIVHTEVEWMKDQPCTEYVFIYHFPRGAGGGGMEHACSTAIDVQAERMSGGDMSAFESVTAHEFFHLWNVKRIRPQSLEPIDYTKEQYTRALWFSEGVTSTVEELILLRAGLITSDEYLRRLSIEIDTLQQRPAHETQSAEESSLDAWLEKYPFYRRPERSISYYNKGEVLGVMLDLAIRDATGGTKSLRDMFLWMNENYAKKGKFFADSIGVRAAVEAVTGKDFNAFFQEYVAGTMEIPYDQFLTTAGLRVKEERRTVADAGFTPSRNFDAPPTVIAVQSGSEAEQAGVKVGDTIVSVENKQGGNVMETSAMMQPGDVLHVRLRARGKERDVKFKLGGREVSHFAIVDVEHPTAAQMNRRAEWLAVPAKASAAPPQGAVRQ